MSLRTFHIVFITVSALVAFFFGVWMLFRGLVDSGSVLMMLGGLAAFGAGVGLILYGIRFIRKLKQAGIY